MSKIGKIILWVVIAVVVIGGIWWWAAGQAGAPSVSSGNNASTTTTSTASTTASSSYPQGNSNQSINQDMTNLNTQLNGLNSDNASVTQSMNDQAIPQVQ